MTTFDKLVTSDLAALATQSRQQLPALDETLRAVSARVRRHDRARAAPDGRLALFTLEAIYAQRAARAAAGAMGILCTAVLLLALHAPGEHGESTWGVWFWILDRGAQAIALAIVAFMMGAYAAGGAIARGRFVRALGRTSVEDPRAPGERAGGLLRSIDGPSVTLAISGVASPAVLVAVMTWLVGWGWWRHLFYIGPARTNYDYSPHDYTRAPFLDLVHGVTALIVGILLAALFLGWACTRSRGSGWVRALERRLIVPAGAVLAAAAAFAALQLHVQALPWRNDHNIPGSALRAPVMTTAAIAAFLIAAGGALWLRRREHGRVNAHRRAAHRPLTVEPLLLSLADVFRRRIARMAGGSVALAYALTLLIVLHDMFGGRLLRVAIAGAPGFYWTEWFVHGRMSGPVLAIVLVVAAQLLAGRLAGRAFERRLERFPVDDLDRSGVEHGRRLARRLDAVSVAVGIAGLASLAALFAILRMAVDDSMWVFLHAHGPRRATAVAAVLRNCELAVGLAIAAALAVGIVCARERRAQRRSRWLGALGHRAILPFGLIAGIVASVIGADFDFGVFDISLPAVERPPLAHQIGLMVMTTAAALLVTTSYALRRRRDEHARLGPS
jgi:hypothetical protein